MPANFYSYYMTFARVTSPITGKPHLIVTVYDKRHRPTGKPLFWSNIDLHGMEEMVKLIEAPDSSGWFYGGIDEPDIIALLEAGERPLGSEVPPGLGASGWSQP